MKPARTILAALIIFVLQLVLAPRIRIAGASPDLLIILLAAIALGRGPVFAVVAGALIGFLSDLGNASFLGIGVVAKSIIAYGMARLGGVLPEHVLYRGFVILAACLVNDLVTLAVTTSFSPGDILFSFGRYSILSAIYSAIVGVVVFAVLELFGRKAGRSDGGA
ncbi:MAG: rod shape-determining protein MreD [Candidatus Latescibacterota bacterium]|jgi:rod shape-determining protein MreD|nr:MAG: rod shape-determining protein MreD [Candidatus Latescibacterota bacterium]